MGQVLAVVSGKGGTGKTSLCAGVACALAADGQTEITELHHIDRGYENLIEKFQSIGADIVRITDAE